MDFSQFGLTQATVGTFSINTSDGKFKNIWVGSAGLNWPLGGNWTAQFGLAYASSSYGIGLKISFRWVWPDATRLDATRPDY